ncbi:MAG: flagellar FliJ family protein [Nitrospirae bacterium]|nr:flagellar FliJ family protein [Nitrospirota bacterium]
MTFYRPKFQSFLQYLRFKEETAKADIDASLRKIAGEQEILLSLHRQVLTAQSLFEKNPIDGINPDEAALAYRFVHAQADQIKEQAKRVLEAEKAYEQKKAEFLEIVREKKAIEKIEAARKREFINQIVKNDQQETDEIGMQLKWRNK